MLFTLYRLQTASKNAFREGGFIFQISEVVSIFFQTLEVPSFPIQAWQGSLDTGLLLTPKRVTQRNHSGLGETRGGCPHVKLMAKVPALHGQG